MKKIFAVILGLLVVANISFIFYQSSKNAQQSTAASSYVSDKVADIVVPDLPQRPTAEQNQIMRKIRTWTRTMAHAIEFASLGFLSTLFFFALLKNDTSAFYQKLIMGWLFSVVCAFADETIQRFADGRASEIKDVGIDALGALTGTGLAFCLWLLIRLTAKRKAKSA